MRLYFGWLSIPLALLAVGRAAGQTRPPQGPSATITSGPQQVPAEASQTQAPFRLTPQEEANLDWVLNTWQQQSEKTKTFGCDFTRWEYDAVFGDPGKPSFIDEGRIEYRAPDKGMFQVERPKEREEKWVSDGTSIYEFDFANKQLIQHKLPPELQGKAIAQGPLPFIFGAEAAKLKQRYFLRIVTPADALDKEIWLEAFPRLQQDAATFSSAQLILTRQNMTPYALQIHAPNGQNRTVYQFKGVVVNDPLGFLKGNPFHPVTPPLWTKVVEEAPAAQVGRQPGPADTR
jgi:TIGR03009 family protein